MSDDQGLGQVVPTAPEDTGDNRDSGLKEMTDFGTPLASDQLSLWLENAPTFSTDFKEDHEGYAITLDDLSGLGVPSSLQLEQMNPGEIPCLEDGQSSGTKRMDASDSRKMHMKETTDEDGEKEMTDGCNPQKRKRSAELHNLNERIRRQKLKDKMKVLRELIPNCNKRDKASTLEDAINYIKALQYQVQMVPTGVGHSPMMHFPSFLQAPCLRGGGMGYGPVGSGTTNMFSSAIYPNQIGLLIDPCSLPQRAYSTHDSRNRSEPPHAMSFPSSGSRSLIREDGSPSHDKK